MNRQKREKNYKSVAVNNKQLNGGKLYLHLNGGAFKGIKEEGQNLGTNILPARLLQDDVEIL